MSAHTTSSEDFFSLLNEISSETFPLKLTDGNIYNFRQLTTAQLKELIKTIVDSPLTQSQFNQTCSKVMEQSFVEGSIKNLNVIDRLLFVLETRVQSLSPSVTISRNEQNIEINIQTLKNELEQKIEQNSDKFKDLLIEQGDLKLSCGVSLISVDDQLSEEIYKNFQIDIQSVDELRKLIGEAFINEIAKAIKTVTIKDKSIVLAEKSFTERLRIVESLPASVINKVVQYVEGYKLLVDSIFVIEGSSITIDGSLFTLR